MTRLTPKQVADGSLASHDFAPASFRVDLVVPRDHRARKGSLTVIVTAR